MKRNRSERLALTRNICGTSNQTNESLSGSFRPKAGKIWSAAVAKTTPERKGTHEEWNGINSDRKSRDYSNRTNESPSRLLRSKADKTWSAAVGKTSPDSSMTVKSGKGVMKLDKPLKSAKAHKEMQRDAKRQKGTYIPEAEGTCTERNGHYRGSPTA